MGTNESQRDSDDLDRERALNTSQVGELLGLSPITLAQMRARGDGPRFFRAGRRHVRYRLGDVMAYRDERTVGRKVGGK